VGKLTGHSNRAEVDLRMGIDGRGGVPAERQWRPRRRRPIGPGSGSIKLEMGRRRFGAMRIGSGAWKMGRDSEGWSARRPAAGSARLARRELEGEDEGEGTRSLQGTRMDKPRARRARITSARDAWSRRRSVAASTVEVQGGTVSSFD